MGAPDEYSGGQYAAGRAYVFTPTLVLSGRLSGGQLVLEWLVLMGATGHRVYGGTNRPYFEPGLIWPYWYRQATLGSRG